MIDLNPHHLETVNTILAEHVPECEVRAFGSRATWTAKDYSDLDLAIVGKGPLEWKALGRLKEAFEESNLPMRVDVLDWHSISESFRKAIKRDCVVLQRRGKQIKTGDWRKVTLGGFAPFTYGKSLPTRKRKSSGTVPVFGSNGVIGYHDETLTDGPTIVIGRKGTVGAVHYSPCPCWPIDTTFFVTGHDAELMRFKYYAFRNLGLNDMNSDSAVPGLNRNAAHAREVRIPNESEQRRIAHILGTLDDKINLNRRMNATLEGMAWALFKSWFVDFEPVRAKMDGRWRRGESLPGMPAELYDLFPERLVTSEVGDVPERWEVKNIGDIATIVGGTTPSTRMPEYWDGGVHFWVTPKDLSSLDSPVLSETARKITDAGLERITSGLLPIGSVLLSSRAPIGYLAISEIPVAINQGFIGILPNEGISNLFMLYWCKFSHTDIINHANGSTFLEINKRNFRQLQAIVPSTKILSEFDRLAQRYYRSIELNEQQSRTLAALRDALLPGLVSGEVEM